MTQEDLYKMFPVGDTGYTIARIDYESMPCSMLASWFSDKEMEDLALEISRFFVPDGENKDADDDVFWEEMERCAVLMGMLYYEDAFEKWLEAFQELPVCIQVGIFNNIVTMNEEIFPMSDFDRIVRDELEFTPSDVFIWTYYNSENINPNDDWWRLSGHGNFETLDQDAVLDIIETYYEKIFENEEEWLHFINPKDLKDDDD